MKNVTGGTTTLLEASGQESVVEIQRMLLQSLSAETEAQVRLKIADTTSQLAQFLHTKKGMKLKMRFN